MGVFSKTSSRITRQEREEFLNDLESTLQFNALEGCCGIIEISNFENISGSDLIRHKASAVSFLKDKNVYSDRVAMHIVSINHLQIRSVVPILEEAGFTMLMKGTNKGYNGNAVFLWGKVINPTRKTGKVK